jgi:hypothetical protein
MRRRIIAGICVAVAAASTLLASAAPVQAREIRIIGCDSLLNWPCPGPMP